MNERNSSGFAVWAGFLVASFAVVALIGLFATYAVALPHARWASRDSALQTAETLLRTGGQSNELAALRLPLGDAAKALEAPDPLAAIQVARAESRAFFLHQSEAIQSRLRLLLVIGALVAAGFGVIVLRIAGRGRR